MTKSAIWPVSVKMRDGGDRAGELRLAEEIAFQRFMVALYEFGASLEAYLIKAGFNPNQPRVPAGQPNGGQWTRVGGTNYEAIAKWEKWGKPEKLQSHFESHGKDLKATSARDYARQARQLYERAHKQKLPMVIDRDGIKRVYDPKTNIFASYNKNGTTRTIYKPRAGLRYFLNQIQKHVRDGGRIISPLPEPKPPSSTGGSRGGGGGGRGGGGGSTLDPLRSLRRLPSRSKN